MQPCHVQRCVGQGAGSGQDQPRLRDSCRVSAAERAGGEGASCPTGEAFPGTGPSAHPQIRCQGEGHHEQARHLASPLQPGRTSHLLGPVLPGAPEHVGAHLYAPHPREKAGVVHGGVSAVGTCFGRGVDSAGEGRDPAENWGTSRSGVAAVGDRHCGVEAVPGCQSPVSICSSEDSTGQEKRLEGPS